MYTSCIRKNKKAYSNKHPELVYLNPNR